MLNKLCRIHTNVPERVKRVTQPTAPMSTTDHLLVGEKMKKEDAGGIGSFLLVAFISERRRGRAPTSASPSPSSVILHTHTHYSKFRTNIVAKSLMGYLQNFYLHFSCFFNLVSEKIFICYDFHFDFQICRKIQH